MHYDFGVSGNSFNTIFFDLHSLPESIRMRNEYAPFIDYTPSYIHLSPIVTLYAIPSNIIASNQEGKKYAVKHKRFFFSNKMRKTKQKSTVCDWFYCCFLVHTAKVSHILIVYLNAKRKILKKNKTLLQSREIFFSFYWNYKMVQERRMKKKAAKTNQELNGVSCLFVVVIIYGYR